ncbi:hypothetical protein P0136_08580 [Lentisphaerota bacterium ZTH]|nr:hypothetical protein JYG24_00315 [Lentisphaerota bacterium]WET05420.1 hypothetical protein P0136_08580 [Lentisphaerota bacterium ZTH]
MKTVFYKTINYFNMIEITLAMGVVAVGMTSILSLFPVGLNTARNSIVEGLSASAVDQFLTYVKFHCKKSASYKALFINASGFKGSIDRTDAVVKNSIKASSGKFLADFKAGTSVDFSQVKGLNLYGNNGSDASLGKVFFAVQGGENANKLDYSAMILAWKQPVENSFWDISGSAYSKYIDNTFEKSAGLCIEVSWPATIDYVDREKRYYYVEIQNPE